MNVTWRLASLVCQLTTRTLAGFFSPRERFRPHLHSTVILWGHLWLSPFHFFLNVFQLLLLRELPLFSEASRTPRKLSFSITVRGCNWISIKYLPSTHSYKKLYVTFIGSFFLVAQFIPWLLLAEILKIHLFSYNSLLVQEHLYHDIVGWIKIHSNASSVSKIYLVHKFLSWNFELHKLECLFKKWAKHWHWTSYLEFIFLVSFGR